MVIRAERSETYSTPDCPTAQPKVENKKRTAFETLKAMVHNLYLEAKFGQIYVDVDSESIYTLRFFRNKLPVLTAVMNQAGVWEIPGTGRLGTNELLQRTLDWFGMPPRKYDRSHNLQKVIGEMQLDKELNKAAQRRPA